MNDQDTAAVVLICPNREYRGALTHTLEALRVKIISQLAEYPVGDQLAVLIDRECDAFVVDVDTDSRAALDLVETICSRNPWATVMVCSAHHDQDLLVRSMRAGAREFLSGEIPSGVLSSALERGAARRLEHGSKKSLGAVLAFWGAKGGSGVTTVATNFAIALRNQTGGEVALLDLNPHLGGVAVLLGLTPGFTIADALADPDRLDGEFLSGLLARHRSGVSLIAAPDEYHPSALAGGRGVGKLLELVRVRFPYIVVDAGLSLGASAETLFQMARTVYLVTQADIPSLRNSQRFIAHFRGYPGLRVELVLNRAHPSVEFDDQRIGDAVGIAPRWKVPNDFAVARRASNTGTPLLLEKSPAARVFQHMACAVCGQPLETEKKRRFLLFG